MFKNLGIVFVEFRDSYGFLITTLVGVYIVLMNIYLYYVAHPNCQSRL